MHDLEFEHLHVGPRRAAQRGRLGRRQCRADHRRHRHRLLDLASDVRARASAAARHCAVEPLRGGQPQGVVALADPADALSARLHHRRRRARRVSSAAATPTPASNADEIDSGAVILTGEAIKRRNARAIADLFAEESGKFVCASAGHHMECQMAAHGSGAVALSQGARRHRAQCRHRRRHHQACADRERRDPCHRRHRRRRAADRRGHDGTG